MVLYPRLHLAETSGSSSKSSRIGNTVATVLLWSILRQVRRCAILHSRAETNLFGSAPCATAAKARLSRELAAVGSTGAAHTACAAPSSAAARTSRGAAALQPCRSAAPLVPLSGVRYAPPEPLQTIVEHPRTGGYGGAARRAREGSCGVHWRRERAQPTPSGIDYKKSY